jgi:hypothetical protein
MSDEGFVVVVLWLGVVCVSVIILAMRPQKQTGVHREVVEWWRDDGGKLAHVRLSCGHTVVEDYHQESRHCEKCTEAKRNLEEA